MPWLKNLKMMYAWPSTFVVICPCKHKNTSANQKLDDVTVSWPQFIFKHAVSAQMLGNDDESPFRIITVQSFGSQPLLNLTVSCSVPWKLTSLATVKKALPETLAYVYSKNENTSDKL